MILTGAQIILECLKEQEVTDVFGYPGATNLAIYDALYQTKGIRHILTSHEQGACHAADGYARATGKVGVCMATSGPGATNLVTGIATAMMDSVAIVAITCNVKVESIGRDSFQEIDIVGVTMPITKHNFLVKRVEELADTIRRAFAIARTGRPGPVLIDIAKDVTTAETDYVPLARQLVLEEYGLLVTRGETEDVHRLAGILKKAKKPLLLVGGGALHAKAEEEIMELAARLDAPVCETLMGKGVYPGTGERYLGMTGMCGNTAANRALEECDVLLALGVRFSERLTGEDAAWGEKRCILQVDIDPAEINKNVLVTDFAIGDVREVSQLLLKSLTKQTHIEWMSKNHKRYQEEQLDIDRKLLLERDDTRPISGAWMIRKLDELTAGNAVIATDVGQHQMWTAQNYLFSRKGQLLTSGGLGSMGYGLPAAIGAAFGLPGKKVINITGDGCFRMNMNELATVSRYRLPIIEIVFDNHMLGMVHQWQEMFCECRYSETEFSDTIDYVRIAEAMGIKAYRVSNRAEATQRVEEALISKGPVVVVCELGPEDIPLSSRKI